jgi:hypothetical protein
MTPEQRVEMLLKFALTDFGAMTPKDRIDWWNRLYATQSEQPGRTMPHMLALEETHIRLRDAITKLSTDQHVVVYVPAMGWRFLPPVRRRAGTRHSDPITRDASALRFDRRHMPSTVILRFVDDLNRIGADRLRTCPLIDTTGQPCGRIFLATRRQAYCQPEHAQAAAWAKYKPTRKQKNLEKG